MARTPAVYGTSNKLFRAMNQRRAVTGMRMTPDEIRAMVSGELDVEAARSLEGARLEERKRQFDKSFALKEDALAAEERAAAISGAADIASLGYNTFVTAPKERAMYEARTKAIEGLTGKVTGAGGTAGAGAAPAVGGETLGALDAAGAVGGELGGSVATGGVPEAFVSSTTGEVVSTATGEAVAGAGTEAAGAGTLGTIGAGVGAFSAGQLGANIFGEGGILQVGGGKGAEVAGVGAGIAMGAAYGSVLPGIGTVVGGVLGGLGAVTGGTVICEELQRQGYLDKRTVAYDYVYRIFNIDNEAYFGYRLWSEPLVRLMQKSWLLTQLIRPLGIAWAHTMANRANPEIPVTPVQKWIGDRLLKYGLPFCRRKARSVLKKSEVSHA